MESWASEAEGRKYVKAVGDGAYMRLSRLVLRVAARKGLCISQGKGLECGLDWRYKNVSIQSRFLWMSVYSIFTFLGVRMHGFIFYRLLNLGFAYIIIFVIITMPLLS